MKRIIVLLSLLLATPLAFGANTNNNGIPNATKQYPYIPVNNMALGANHTCALIQGKITCWGSDLFGQTNVPKGIVDPIQVAAGGQNTCALGKFYVTCWGLDGYNIFPVKHGTYMDTKGTHVCVIDDSGVSCYRGNNRYGQLDVPAGLEHPRQVVTGLTHTCVLDDNGVHCWGSDKYGETDVPQLDHPTMITAAANDTCALDDGRVLCWGANNYGQLNVPALQDVKYIAAGFDTICALDRFGVECWGRDAFHQADVPSLLNPVYVQPGTHHTCVLEAIGPLCWGYDAQGQTDVPQSLRDEWAAMQSRNSDENIARSTASAPQPTIPAATQSWSVGSQSVAAPTPVNAATSRSSYRTVSYTDAAVAQPTYQQATTGTDYYGGTIPGLSQILMEIAQHFRTSHIATDYTPVDTSARNSHATDSIIRYTAPAPTPAVAPQPVAKPGLTFSMAIAAMTNQAGSSRTIAKPVTTTAAKPVATTVTKRAATPAATAPVSSPVVATATAVTKPAVKKVSNPVQVPTSITYPAYTYQPVTLSRIPVETNGQTSRPAASVDTTKDTFRAIANRARF